MAESIDDSSPSFIMVAMETILEAIIRRLAAGESMTERDVIRLIDTYNRELARSSRNETTRPQPLMKRQLLPLYRKIKSDWPNEAFDLVIDEDLERRLVELLRVKPRRSASGVATITVLTKPWPCSGQCLYCPADVRMPKSYLADEPACRRAEGLWFDPYLQVANRLRHLRLMGHPTRNVELIIAGGTWQDYPLAYRRWFVSELLRAATESAEDELTDEERDRINHYEAFGLTRDRDQRRQEVAPLQAQVNVGAISYNEAVNLLYGNDSAWEAATANQTAGWDDLEAAWQANKKAACRVRGLAIETRPELLDGAAIESLHRFGVTRVQLGLQSLDESVLTGNGRIHPPAAMAEAFRRLRDGGFVIHGHYMLNLPGSTPPLDLRGFQQLIDDPRFRPDEVKLYPCVLVESAPLMRLRQAVNWQPYSEETLLDVMADILAAAPPWLRISRMVRDISAHDVVAGAHRPNARQLVQGRLQADGRVVVELRSREIATDRLEGRTWMLKEQSYETSSGVEWFLSWEDEEGRVRSYARLTLGAHPILREVHELGADAAENDRSPYAKALVDRAAELAGVGPETLAQTGD